MRCPLFVLPCLLATMLACGFVLLPAGKAAAQFDDDNRGRNEDSSRRNGSSSDRDDNRSFRGREEQGERGDRQGFRGGPRPNPMFEALDVDGDGLISARELRQAAKNLKELDADGDGSISLEEASPMRGPGGDPSQMFDRFDANGDGKLTADELRGPMAGMLQNGDTNGDGAIDRDELQQAMQNMRGRGFFGPGGGFGGPGGGFGGPGGGFGDPDTMTRQVMSMDRNGDGLISRSEMNPQMAGMLQGADTNGDGALNAKEVAAAMQNARQRFEQFRAQGGNQGGFDRGRPDRGSDRNERRRGRDDDQQ